MKKIIQFILILLFPILGSSQSGTTVDQNDTFGPFTYSYNGLVNGKHSYREDAIGITLSYSTSNSRWEIVVDGDAVAIHYSTVPTDMNPPNFTIGNWMNFDDGAPLLALSGSGTTDMVLPVKLISFEGTTTDKSIIINWQTASEVNNDKFEIQRSHNGVEFKRIAEVKGNGTRTNQTDYEFEDRSTFQGVSYYRLKQIDFDGQFEYSKVISVNYRGEVEDIGQFYPNPSHSQTVNLSYASQNDREISVSVYDMTGQLVFKQNQQVASGENNLSFDFLDLNSGAYIVTVGDEVNFIQRKLIIN